MDFQSIYETKKITLDQFLNWIRPEDRICVAIAAAQPQNLLKHLSNRNDWKKLEIFTGLCAFPYPFLTQPNVELTSGYYGPVERMLNEMGARMAYLPLGFSSFEIYVETFRPRVILTTLSKMDESGFLSFGTNSEAVFGPFLKAARNPNCVVIAEVNSSMPEVSGLADFESHRIHISEIDALVETDTPVLELPSTEATDVEKKIAENVLSLVRAKDTLQFGIGGIPNEVARRLAEGSLGDFGVHSELISDGFLKMLEAGKISNRFKGIHQDVSLFTFALGSEAFYRALDAKRSQFGTAIAAAPVSYVNNPSVIGKNRNMVSINSGLMIDFSGQVCSEAIGVRQYSGVGGQLNFVEGAFHSPGGRSILCIKSSVEIDGKRHSNIVNYLPQGSIISTPRHFVQYVVTEYGVATLYGLSDEQRPEALVKIAHPDFRDQLIEEANHRDRLYYHRLSS